MKNILKIIKMYLYILTLPFLMGQGQAFKYNLFPGPSKLKDIYITEEKNSYSMMLEFSGPNFD